MEKSRPPVYSPELTTLLTSQFSRNKPLKPKRLDSPPKLPARADPTSEEARLVGPLSKRREVNIRWRYYTEEWKKILPPLQVQVRDKAADTTAVNPGDVQRAGIRPIGLQGAGVQEELHDLATQGQGRPLPRREQRSRFQEAISPQFKAPRRFVRRRFQDLLGQIPVLTYTHSVDSEGNKTGRYTVSSAGTRTVSSRGQRSLQPIPVITDSSLLAWLPKEVPKAKV